MSFVIHIFMAHGFQAAPYWDFLEQARTLFGCWSVAESTPIYGSGHTIHECFLKSETLNPDENVRVNVRTTRRVNDITTWHFDYEWGISFETGAGRSALSLAVQLGLLSLAAQRFQWFLVIDRDTYLGEYQQTEFRSSEELARHLRLILGSFPDCCADLQKRGILDKQYSLLLPPR